MPANPNKALAAGGLANFGITKVLRRDEPGDLAAKLSERTKRFGSRPPVRSRWSSSDLPMLVGVAHAVDHRTDNTWGAGLAFAPFDFNGSG
jgi:cystathionine beta-lyase